MPLLVVIEKGSQTAFVIGQDDFSIGRDQDADLILADENVSRRHARITSDGASYFLTDLGSRNGTKLNGIPIKENFPNLIRYKDVVLIGNTLIKFVDDQRDTGELVNPDDVIVDRVTYEKYLAQLNVAEKVQSKATIERPQAPIFISHSSHDDVFVTELVKRLNKEKIFAWADHIDIKPGARWDEEVEKALNDSIAMIVVVSSAARASENVRAEWTFFKEQGKPIFPIKIEENCPTPLFLVLYQQVDLTSDEVEAMARLAKTLKELQQ